MGKWEQKKAAALQFEELYAHPDAASLAQLLSGSREAPTTRKAYRTLLESTYKYK